MNQTRVLILAYDRPTDLLRPGGPATEELSKRFPSCEFRFKTVSTATAEDLGWAEVVSGNPAPSALRQMTAAKWIHYQSAGLNEYADPALYPAPRPIVTRTADVFGIAMAEHTLAMLLSLNRALPAYQRKQAARRWDRTIERYELCGATVLMLGMGSLAADLTQRLQGFACRIIGLRRDAAKPAEGYARVYGFSDLHAALREADYIINTLPLTAETAGMLDEAAFAAMKPRAMLLNIGRGGTVDTGALVEALRSGQIAGAGLDVTDPEPLPENSPLWEMENVIITPHSSGFSENTDRRRLDCLIGQLARYLSGEPLLYQVDFARGY